MEEMEKHHQVIMLIPFDHGFKTVISPRSPASLAELPKFLPIKNARFWTHQLLYLCFIQFHQVIFDSLPVTQRSDMEFVCLFPMYSHFVSSNSKTEGRLTKVF